MHLVIILDKRNRFVFPRIPPQRASDQFLHLFLEYLGLEAIDYGIDGRRAQSDSLCPFQSSHDSSVGGSVTKNHRDDDQRKPAEDEDA